MDGVASCSYNSNERLSRLHSHNKKVIKHALRQQAKRRRKNTTIASGNSGMLPRIIVKTLPPKPPEELTEECYRASTGKEILASIHGFSVKKPRKRTNKKLSMAAQLEQTKEGCIDLETPDSILVNTNIKALLNNDTFRLLPLLYQHKLVQLLPDVDRPNLKDPSSKLSMSGLSNEFFTRACLEWRERLAEGEFTPENQQKLKTEAEKERSKLDPWKIKHFEPMWGDKGFPNNNNNIKLIVPTSTSSRPSLKTTIKLKPLTTICNKHTKSPPMLKKRLRTVGAVTRAITSYREENNSADEAYDSPDKPIIPDLLPIKSVTSKFQCEIQRPEIVQVHSSDSRESDDAKEEVDPLQITDSFSGFDNDNAAMSVSDIIDSSERTTSEKRSRSESPTEESEIKLKRRSPEIFPCDPELFTVKSNSPYPETLSEKDSEQDNLVLPDPISVPDIIPDQDTSSLKDSSSVKDVPMSEQETCSQLTYDSENNVNSSDLFDKNIQEDDSESKQEFIDINTHLVCSVSPEHSLDDKDKVFPDDKEVELQRIEELMTHHKDSSDTEENNHLADVIESLHTGLIQGAKLPNSLILHQDSIILNKEDDTDGPNSDNNFEKFEASVKESDLVTFGENVNMNTENEIDTNEDRFIDAEIFVLESGAIASQDLNSSETNTERESAKDEINDDEDTEGDADEMQVALFAAAVARGEDSCWDVVDSSTEKLLAEVPLHSLESVNVPVSMNVTNNDEQGSGDVEVIPMKEELEVRLEEGAFPVPNDWSYVLKMDSEMVAAALSGNNLPENSESSCLTESENKVQYPEYSTANQVKLELEVTLTPETVTSNDNMVTSTVGSSTNCTDSSTLSAKSTVTTIIPPTTIVCLPSVVAPSNPHVSQLAVNNITNILRSNVVASSSALPLLALSTNQPIRAVSQHTTTTKIKSNKSNRESQVLSGNTSSNRSRSSNKPPPGAVNLERSYQICQAVIQNSPNRDQLRCQLKPPPSLLAAQNSSAGVTNKKVTTQYGAVSSSRNTANKTFVNLHPSSNAQPKQGVLNQTKQINARGVQFQQRQQSPPVVLRHVFTSSQGIPVTMAVLPQAQPAIQPGVVEAPAGPVGQYILVRNNMMEHHTAPRASSAPPSNSQAQIFGSGVSGMVTTNQITTGIANPRLRPASVDVERPQQQQVLLYGPQQGPHPGIQAISKRNKMYGDVSMENYSISADNVAAPGSCQPQIMKNVNQRQAIPHSDSSCACNLKAMIVCKNCGAFCHDDCIGPSKLCVTCLIR